MSTDTPWSVLPPTIGELLRPRLPDVVNRIVESIPREVPSYARSLEGEFAASVRLGVDVALGRFLELPGTQEPALREADYNVYFALGAGELHGGRRLEALMAAYQVGARVAFRGLAANAMVQSLDADVLLPLTESIFVYVEQISAASAAGFAAEQSARAGETERRRAELMALLLSGTADPVTIAQAASRIGWSAPQDVVAILVHRDRIDGLAGQLGPHCLVAAHADGEVALAPAPATPLTRRRLVARLEGRRAAIGPARPLAEAASSLRLASIAAALVERGVLTQDPVWVDRHLATIIVHREPDLVTQLATDRLAPLDGLRDATRRRLEETLLAWLRHRGERQHVAAELHIHPQTVGYRLGQLRDLFGATLDEPDARFDLELVLRGRYPTR